MKTTKPKRPILRYHGGKWLLAEWIISRFPPHRVYVEPFGGAASVLMQKPLTYAEIYNDLDGEICNLFRVVRDNSSHLVRELIWTPFSRAEYRESFEIVDDPLEMARRTVIRSFMGFGSNSINREIQSGFRSNAQRSGTTPAHDWKNLPLNMRAVARRLRGVVIENKPAMKVMEQHDDTNVLHYCDPPYVHATRSLETMHGNHGYAHEMTDEQHEELAEFLKGLKGMVVLSGYHGKLYDRLYARWDCETRPAMADGAKPRLEVLWFNGSAARALMETRQKQSLF